MNHQQQKTWEIILNTIRFVTIDPGRLALSVSHVSNHIGKGGFHLAESVMSGCDLHYVADGETQFIINEKRHIVRAGEAIIRFSGDQTSAQFNVPVSIYHCHFSFGKQPVGTLNFPADQTAENNNSDLLSPNALILADHLAFRDKGRAVELLAGMVAAADNHLPGGGAATAGFFLLFLGLYTQETLALMREQTVDGPAVSPAFAHVSKAINLINSRMHNPLSLDEVAQCLRINPDYLSRIFKRHTGETVGGYVLKRKIALAQNLLLGAPASIKEIAKRVGITDQLYFSRMFRKATGMSPVQYRKSKPG